MSRAYVVSHIVGEIAPADIPLSSVVSDDDLATLKAGDDDPMEVVIEVAPGKSSRGWNYTPAAIRKLVDHVQARTLSGILGHQREEDLSTQFVSPASHWIGAKWDEQNQRAYFRGVIDRTQPDLKRWIRAKRITQPSIFTRPTLRRNEVIDLEPLSIDFAPLGRAGMQTANIVAWGEMKDGEHDTPPPPPQGGTHMERSEVIQAVAALHDAPATLGDLAERDDGWRALNSQARVAGELATKTGKSAGELLTYVTELEAAKARAEGEMAEVRTLLDNPSDVKATLTRILGENADLKGRLDTLRVSTLKPRVDAVAGEMVGELLAPFFAQDVMAATPGKDIESDEGLRAVAGEVRQTDKWKAHLERAQATGSINPPPARSNNGTHGPDMSIFGSATTTIGA